MSGEAGVRSGNIGARRAIGATRLLESAIAHEQIEVLYQPLIEPSTGRIVGAEALARSAMAFVRRSLFSRASAAGLDERLSRLVQRKALRCAAVGKGRSRVSRFRSTCSRRNFARQAFDQWLLDEIEAAGIDPKRVTVEITESALLIDQPAVAERLGRLRAEGLGIAVDDFGTGYASLAYLTSLPLDMIKIDRGLITDIVGGERDRIVVKAMIRLARELGLGGGRRRRRKHRPARAPRRLGLRSLPGVSRRGRSDA